MTPPRPEQPATAAGRALVQAARRADPEWHRFSGRIGPEALNDRILAIEREAAAPLSVAELARALHSLLPIEPGQWTAWRWNDEAKQGGQDVRLNSSELAAAILAEIERGRG